MKKNIYPKKYERLTVLDLGSIKKVALLTMAVIAFGVILGGASRFFSYKANATKIRCSVFHDQADAQAHYRKSLDRNRDGKACTSYDYK